MSRWMDVSRYGRSMGGAVAVAVAALVLGYTVWGGAAPADTLPQAQPSGAQPSGAQPSGGESSAPTQAAPSASAPTAPQATTYAGFGYGPNIDSPTKNKPQSKLWFADGAWWAVMVNSGAEQVRIFELLDNHAWRDTGAVVDNRAGSTADVLWDGQQVHIATRLSQGEVRYLRFSYDGANRTYVEDVGRVAISGDGASSVALALDAAGRPWVTFVQDGAVLVAHATAPEATRWTPAFALPVPEAAATPDDIASIDVLPGAIGVMWSNQRTGGFHFLVHDDGAPDSEWNAVETPLQGAGMADGHVNLLTRDDGTAYAAVKTSQDDVEGAPGRAPLVVVLERAVDGTWTQHVAATVSDRVTRPELALTEDEQLLYLFYATPSGGGRVFYKLSDVSRMQWGVGPGTLLMAADGARLNNVTGTKQKVGAQSGLVLLASDDSTRRYFHTELELGPGDAGTGEASATGTDAPPVASGG